VFLSSADGKAGRWQQTGPASASAAPQRRSSRRQPAAKQPPKRGSSRARNRTPGIPNSVSLSLKIGFRIALVAIALLIARYLWIAFDVQGSASGVTDVLGSSKDSALRFLEAPKRRFMAAVEQDLRRIDPRSPAPGTMPDAAEKPEAAEMPEAAESQPGQTVAAKTVVQQTAKTHAAPLKVYSYITVGSTRDEVIEQLGPPTASSEDKLVYSNSELYLKGGNVVGWKIDPRSPIKVKLWPTSSVDPSLDHFSVGSTKDAVLVVQGTPTAFTQDEFEYGGSVVYFQNNRVVNWKNDPASIPLRARLN
jgi:outer membrane protein assembly factor BamE (lipoprotein component of BamABCDE complex)